MPSLDIKKRMWSAGIFAMPIVVVLLAGLILGESSPRGAHGSVVQPSTAVSPLSPQNTVSWSPQQLQAARYVDSLKSQSYGPTPLWYEREEQAPVVVPPPADPIIEPPPIVEATPEFSLRAVMSGTRGKTALINGRPYREGDTVRNTQWKVASIDCDHRSVLLSESGSDRTLKISVELLH